MLLRPYQEAAKAALYESLRARGDNPCVVLPTGAGKAPLIASVCKDAVGTWGGRVVVLAHVRELLQQTADKLRRVCPDVPFGVYSAGLNRRDTDEPVIVAGIQSVYKRACELDSFDLAVVDEAHLIAPDGDGMYRQFLADARVVNPHLRVVGFTATPFRMKTGPICTPDGILNHVCYEVGVRELIRDGFLSPLVARAGTTTVDTSAVTVRAGEFVADELEVLMDKDALVQAACAEVVGHTRDRNAVIVFATGVRHGQHVVRVLKDRHGIDAGYVTGETPADARAEQINRFRVGALKYLVNVNVLTTGFDAPNVDCVVLLRPTLSAGLFYQMVGRGFRVHPGKRDCLVLDFGGNVLRHGPVDQVRSDRVKGGDGVAPAKECPDCHALIAAGYAACPHCGFVFPDPQRREHQAKAGEASLLSKKVTTTRYEVLDVFYAVHKKRGAGDDAPRTLRVDYKVGSNTFKSEWVCLEHTGYPRARAVAWWKQRSPDPVPQTAARAAEVARNGGVAFANAITVRTVEGEQFETIVGYEIGDLPEVVPIDDGDADFDPNEIPF